MQEHLLPSFDERNAEIDMLVIHSTPQKADEAISILEERKLSSHYVMDLDGKIIKCVDEKKRAWHAGKGFWRGETNINDRSIGIEICQMDCGQTPFNDIQIEKLIHFCKKIIRKYKIRPEMIVGHSDTAPARKYDPGMTFPWKKLYKEEIGLWYQPRNADKMPENNVAKLLNIIGYDTSDEETTIASTYAFRRRFLPEEVEFVADYPYLWEHVYPEGNKELLSGDKFLKTLKAVAYTYLNASKNP